MHAGGIPEESPLRTRIVLVLALFLLVPLAAEAAKPKSPFYAFVGADGTPSASNGLHAQRSPYDPVGVYWVTLNERPDIVGCVAVATAAGGSVSTIGIDEIEDSIFEITKTTGGGAALVDIPFYVAVYCPKWKKSG